MRRSTGSEAQPTPTVTVLSVSPIEEDHRALESILFHSGWFSFTNCKWNLCSSDTLGSALAAVGQKQISIVVGERDLAPGTWKDLLNALARLPDPPFLIVTSRFADDRLWAEALNLGAYDVLAKPFRAEEVGRILSAAWARRGTHT